MKTVEKVMAGASSRVRRGPSRTISEAQDSKRFGEDAIVLYRKKHGLLSAHEIRALRERFHLTQAGLAHLLRFGANTVSRWESGRNVQTAAMDLLLRLIRDLPGSIVELRANVMVVTAYRGDEDEAE